MTDYYTGVTRGIMDDNLFTTFNSTLSFNIVDLLDYKVANITCGSIMARSAKVNPLAGKLKGRYFIARTGNKLGFTVFSL